MKLQQYCISIIFLIFIYSFSIKSQELYINEFLAINDNGIVDEFGDNNDWIEIYNASTEAIDIGGLYITDDLAFPGMWQIPYTDPFKTTIQTGGYLILWADKEFEQGITHLEIKLSGAGEQIGLSKKVNNEFVYIDTINFGTQIADVSYGRVNNGGNSWQFFLEPTPGSSNSGTFSTLLTEENEIEVFPNPSRGIFQIKNLTLQMYSIFIYEQSGRLLFKTNSLVANEEIDLRFLNNGFYHMIIIDSKNSFISQKKLIIQ